MKITDENEVKRYKLFKRIMQASTQGTDFLIHNGMIKKIEKEEDKDNVDPELKYFLEPHDSKEWSTALSADRGINLFANAYNHVHPTAPKRVDIFKIEYNLHGALYILRNHTVYDINKNTYQIGGIDIKPIDNEYIW